MMLTSSRISFTAASLPSPYTDEPGEFPRPLPHGRAAVVDRGSGLGDGLGRAEVGGGAQRLRLVRLLPGEVVVLTPEVAVGRRLLVDRPVQLEVLTERAR